MTSDTAPASAKAPAPALSPAERRDLKARAHALDPVVIIGDAGLTPAVLKEIERALSAHALIKIRIVNDDRAERTAALKTICDELAAAPVQQIGKLLLIYRASAVPPSAPAASKRIAKKSVRDSKRVIRKEAKRNPVTGKLFILETSTRKTPAGTRPPRTERVRKSGQKSTKKAFQGS